MWLLKGSQVFLSPESKGLVGVQFRVLESQVVEGDIGQRHRDR